MSITDATLEQRRDLDDLVKHPGWLRIVQIEQDWWAMTIDSQLRACANETDDAMALNKMRQLIAAKQAVQRFIDRPKELLREKPDPERMQPTTFMRGGV